MGQQAGWLKWRWDASHLAQLASLAGGVAVTIFLGVHSLSNFFAARPAAGSPEAAFQAQLDRSAPQILRHFHIPGMVISTVVGGVTSHSYAYGYADAATKRPMTTDALFRVASISKSVTAWGIMRLADEGKIDLDAPAERYLGHWPLPQTSFPSKAVTVRELLNHTSGLTAGEDEFRDPKEAALSTRALIHEQATGPDRARLEAPAGSRYAYSVPGYTLLQLIIERQTGRPFADYMHDAVLQPLGMTSSSYAWRPAFSSRISTAYTEGRPTPLAIPQDLAADSLVTTAPDVATFVAAALPDPQLPAGAGVIEPDSVDHLYATSSIPRFELAGLGQDLPGLGYFVETTPNAPTIVTNGGYDPGWSSQFFMAPATNDGLVIVTNGDSAQPAIAQIAAIWTSWRGLPPAKMTRAYRVLGVDAAVVVGLMTMMSLSLAADLVIELMAGRRRFADLHLAALAHSALECALAVAAMAVWTVAKPTIQTLPTFAVVVTVTILSFSGVVLARALMPRLKTEPRQAKPERHAPLIGWARRTA